MKIKEICKRTGLTERTVRYYVEEGLIDPPSIVRNGREYREYSEQDVEQLLTIAALRKLFFTIDEIKDMQRQPERITEVLSAYKLKLATDAKAKAAIVDALEQLNLSELRDREREYELFQMRQARQFKRGKYYVIAIAVINVITTLYAQKNG